MKGLTGIFSCWAGVIFIHSFVSIGNGLLCSSTSSICQLPQKTLFPIHPCSSKDIVRGSTGPPVTAVISPCLLSLSRLFLFIFSCARLCCNLMVHSEWMRVCSQYLTVWSSLTRSGVFARDRLISCSEAFNCLVSIISTSFLSQPFSVITPMNAYEVSNKKKKNTQALSQNSCLSLNANKGTWV